MDMRIEVVFLGVTDVDRAKSFYVDQVGFHADHDQTVHEGLPEMPPGAQQGVMMVVENVAAQRERLVANGVDASEVDVQPWGSFVTFADPDGNTWSLQQLPQRT